MQSPDNTYPVTLLHLGNETSEAEWLLWDDDSESAVSDQVRLSLRSAGREIVQSAETYWESQCAVRRELERDGILVQCYGGSKNVWPSGMALSMGMGKMAYRLVMGQPAKTAALVDIFSCGSDVIPVTVSEQEVFFKEWLASLTEPNKP